MTTSPDPSRLIAAFQKARDQLYRERIEAGHWVGQLSTSALSTATAVSALCANGISNASQQETLQPLIDGGVEWLGKHQNEDGGWGDTVKSFSNISTTYLVIAALHFAGLKQKLREPIRRAEAYVEAQGGIEGVRRRYGKDKTFAVPILANCAMAGIVPWKEVSALPFEAACVPQKFYHWMQLPVVSYAIPALVAIGQAKYIHDPPWNPLTRVLRYFSISRSLNVLERMQPASGGFLEAIPLTSFVVMGLSTTGRGKHQVAQLGIEFIKQSVLEDGSWPIDTNLATWTTTLSVNALSAGANALSRESTADDNKDSSDVLAPQLDQLHCLPWILSCQNKTVHPFTNSPPGGWGWTDLSGAVPDADDTPGAMLALANFCRHSPQLDDATQSEIHQAAASGVDWLLKLQNRDMGWPTFCRGWGRLPFDRSGSDITAHCLRAIFAWKDKSNQPEHKIQRSLARGLSYLRKNQRPDGSWLPLWFGNQDQPDDENPVYGTSKVLAAFVELGHEQDPAAQRGRDWLLGAQNGDGSWGGGPSPPKKHLKFSSANPDSTGTIEETALAIEALLYFTQSEKSEEKLSKAIGWLIDAVETDCYRIDWPIGFYFAKLWYHERLYPQIFAVAALGKAVARFALKTEKS